MIDRIYQRYLLIADPPPTVEIALPEQRLLAFENRNTFRQNPGMGMQPS